MAIKRKLRKLINDPKLFVADSKLVKMIEGNSDKTELKVIEINQDKKSKKVKQNVSAASTQFRNQTEDRSVLSMKYVLKAHASLKDGDLSSAIRLVDQAVAIHPENVVALVEASKIRSKLEEKTLAFEYAEKALSIQPESYFVQENMADIARSHGDYSEQIGALFDELLASSTTESTVLKYLSYAWEKESANTSKYEKLLELVNPLTDNPILVAMLGAYGFEAGDKLGSLKFARALIDRKEGRRLKKYASWYSYCSNYYPLIKTANDRRAVELTQEFTDGSDDLIRRIQNAQRVVIVGNSPREVGKKQGADIDRADLVIRFNNYPVDSSFDVDYGTRTDVWVRSVGSWVEERKLNQFEHVVIAGTNLLGRGFNMTHFMEILDTDISGSVFNEKYHYELIDLLKGPPSAGLMMLYMVYRIRGSLSSQDVYGFGFIDQLNEGVVNIGNSPAGIRHHWQRELELYELMLRGELK
jgi:tetratricopeptide (TPR) repeat protein